MEDLVDFGSEGFEQKVMIPKIHAMPIVSATSSMQYRIKEHH